MEKKPATVLELSKSFGFGFIYHPVIGHVFNQDYPMIRPYLRPICRPPSQFKQSS